MLSQATQPLWDDGFDLVTFGQCCVSLAVKFEHHGDMTMALKQICKDLFGRKLFVQLKNTDEQRTSNPSTNFSERLLVCNNCRFCRHKCTRKRELCPLNATVSGYEKKFLSKHLPHEDGSHDTIECFHLRGQHLRKFIGTKESVYIRKEFNSHRTGLGHQHGRRIIVLGYLYGRRDVM